MSLGNCVFTKSTSLTARRLLAPPRDTLRSRCLSTSDFSPRIFRYVKYDVAQSNLEQGVPNPRLKPPNESNDILHGKATTTPVSGTQERLPRPHQKATWVVPVWDSTVPENPVTDLPDITDPPDIREWSNAVVWDDRSIAGGPPKAENAVARRVAAERKSRQHKISKTLGYISNLGDGLGELHWRRSLNLLIAHTELKQEIDLSKDAQNPGNTYRRGRAEHRFTQIHAEQIPQPQIWSTSSFEDYVASLVKSSVTGSLHRLYYKENDSHIASVVRLLHEIFANPRLYAYPSITACNIAMAYCYKVSHFAEARSILSRMEDHDLLISPETFNIMLRGSAKCKNTQHFNFILKHMIERGLKPNAETWMIFYQISMSDQARSEVYHRMRDMGVLDDPLATKYFLTLASRTVLKEHLEEGRSVASFLECLDGAGELGRLTTAVGNIILDEVGNRSSVQDVMTTLKDLKQYSMKFDEVTLNTVLHHCLSNRDHDDAIKALKRFRQWYTLLPEKLAYDALFLLAWRSRHFNCSKVVWSLLRDWPTGPAAQSMTRGDVWRAAAGKLVVGVSLDAESEAEMYRCSKMVDSPKAEEPTALDSAALGDKTRNIWIDCFFRDFAVAHCFKVDGHLDDLLRQALAMDRQWALEEVSTRKSFTWMLQHSIPVKLKEYFPARFFPEDRPSFRFEKEPPLDVERDEYREDDSNGSGPHATLATTTRRRNPSTTTPLPTIPTTPSKQHSTPPNSKLLPPKPLPTPPPSPPLRDLNPMHRPQMIDEMILTGEAALAIGRLLARAPAGAAGAGVGTVVPRRGRGEVDFHVALQVVVAREGAGAVGVQADVRFRGGEVGEVVALVLREGGLC
ncbi:hypothetical protein G7Y79_00003g009780 [Physcia stellaris]|nr:hypothetical protein G7Y79_00003g009780 [Physcia stellaris]